MVARIHSAFVDRIEGFRTIGVANTGQEAIRLAVALVPDLILLDLYLPDVFGLDVLNRAGLGEPVLRCSERARDGR